jgi:hypothetical protein
MYDGLRIINIDESLIHSTDVRKKGWGDKRKKTYTSVSRRLSSVSIIGGIASSGEFYFTLNQGKNNS